MHRVAKACVVAYLVCGLWSCTSASPLSITRSQDRVAVFVGDELFTEYRFTDTQKYPYFFPVIGPSSGHSLTTESSEPYPHHHSLFFACDHVNGGNYWQQGLDRGRIRQTDLVIETQSGDVVRFVTKNLWERPGAAAPFTDRREIAIRAPRRGLRLIDVVITWTALTNVRIRRTNHALFSARVVAGLSVRGGGVMRNASGHLGEKATFGGLSPWMDCSGVASAGEQALVEGLAIFCHPDNPWSPSRWFTRDYGFFSPTPMHWLPGGKLEIPKGESLTLRYRVVVHDGTAHSADLDALYRSYAKNGADAKLKRAD